MFSLFFTIRQILLSAIIVQNSSDVRGEFQLNNLASSYYFVFSTKHMSWGLPVMINTNLYLSIAYALFSTTQTIYKEKFINKNKSIFIFGNVLI